MNKDNEYQSSQDENSKEGSYQEDRSEVEQELSKVASNPKQNILIIVGIGLVFLYVFYIFIL